MAYPSLGSPSYCCPCLHPCHQAISFASSLSSSAASSAASTTASAASVQRCFKGPCRPAHLTDSSAPCVAKSLPSATASSASAGGLRCRRLVAKAGPLGSFPCQATFRLDSAYRQRIDWLDFMRHFGRVAPGRDHLNLKLVAVPSLATARSQAS